MTSMRRKADQLFSRNVFLVFDLLNGFDTARCQLPSYTWVVREGFSDEEMLVFDQLMHSNAHLFYKYGASGGIQIA